MGKLKTEFFGLIAKSTSPGLSNSSFFARCWWLTFVPGRKEMFCTIAQITLAAMYNCISFSLVYWLLYYSITGSPLEERQPSLSLSEFRPALPTIPPIAPNHTVAQQQPRQQSDVLVSTGRPQEQGESSIRAPTSSTNQSTSSTRVPAPSGTVDTLSRFV